ncbi:uncharacterized protein LOC103718793 isoform X1 [Phoenix dactylifera]|uniref:Uncharacterized protein LOC103718793 isoform X1 n=2 Tax=Phoenix dactylifera TaxID=42345 RepID=A0A8B7CTX0_PHODC|nr:uncharacterized protein LOC103718793 isoform X1 [Phoenix dactylifera]XP_017701122.2 uncharacterized protein LOC103718793 isoform X1 [Phoenix dactylifera]XP_017701123.2 uncharacterized protein LOC103718793 isoform X1 [Phoenix dactylifera]XP_038970203.1 uncharacterized protein LOC103718793 isoform X1 [Phoenix dactylifera]
MFSKFIQFSKHKAFIKTLRSIGELWKILSWLHEVNLRRKSMDCGEANAYGERHSVLMGAIFMCNRLTKKECLERKLFGLPSRQAGFLKNVKAGMLLFLFEHEERKLYGVFEATSDGALNIMPNAFLSSGKSYPAQILCKRIWFCKPLSEDEFRDAINENYYQPYKFDFGLSYDQVLRLIHLFSLKKIRVSQFQRGMPNKLIKQFENSYLGNERVRGKPGSSFDSYEHKPLLTSDDSVVVSQHGRDPTVPCATRALPDLTRSSSQNDYALRRTFPITSPYVHRYYDTVPGCGAELPYIDLGLNRPSLAEELNAHTRYFSDAQVPYLRSQPSLLSDPKTFELPSNYRSMDVCASDGTYKGSSFTICEPSRVGLPSIGSVGCPKPFIGSGGCTDLQDYKHSSILDHHDSSASKIFASLGMNMTKGIDSRPSSHSLGIAHDDPKATLQDDGLRGQHRWVSGPSPDFISLPEDDSSLFHSSLSKDASVISNSSLEFEEGNGYQELRSYQLMHDEGYDDGYYPTSVSSRLHSDNYQKRTSVFSRLSKASETRRQCKVVCKPYRNPSLDQLLDALSQRRDLLSKMDKMVPQKSSIQDDDQQYEKITDMEPVLATSVGEFETNSKEVAEESSEIPFLNFKRRSEVRKMEGGNEARADIEGRSDEGSLGKRRRLVRPSFCEDECQDVQKSSQEIVRGGVLVKNGEAENTVDGDSSVRIYEESGNKSSSSPAGCTLSCVIDKLKIDSNGLNACMNDTAGRCLLKSNADHTVVSTWNTKHEEKANTALQAAGVDLSVLQGYSESRHQKFGEGSEAFLVKTDNIESEDYRPLKWEKIRLAE